MKKNHPSRREFVKQSALLTGSLLTLPLGSRAEFFNTSVDDTIKVAVVGCGGRGTGAALQALFSRQNVKLVAMADAFRDRLDSAYAKLTGDVKAPSGAMTNLKERVVVPEENKFVGFDSYKQAIPLADVVILATPPGFRPAHFEEAIRLGKHVFMEKPVATDPVGIRKVLESAAIAKQKKLNVVVGLQRHYQNSYRELHHRVKEGMIGEIVSAQAWWNNDGVWVNPRKAGQTEMEYQMRNWYYFTWICGDHIVEQHIHNMDVINWFKGDHPAKAQGMGGREVRKGKDFGEIFDHHYVEFQYPDGSILNSQCRHIKGTMDRVDEQLAGTKGNVYCGAGRITDRQGKVLYQFDKAKENNPYQTEHDELFEAISRKEYKFADAENGANSTMTAILGRMATYSGQLIEWDQALHADLNLMPPVLAWDARPLVLPDADGIYPAAIPGVTRYFS